MNEKTDQRRRVLLTREERAMLQWLFVKTLVPMAVIILISSGILFFGLQFLMNKTGFANYGLAPQHTVRMVSQFITAYLAIALANVVLMLALSAIVIFIILRHLVMPLLRVTRDLKNRVDARVQCPVTVRSSDRFLIPLVDTINRLLKRPPEEPAA